MIWLNFPIIALLAGLLWTTGIVLNLVPRNDGARALRLSADAVVLLGIGVLGSFIVALWLHLERPPLRTMGETRLWYSLFLTTIGFLTYLRWRYRWFLALSLGMAIIFLVVNYLNPDTYDKTLMPALQSPWFIPHVSIMLLSYALVAASSIVGAKALYQTYFGQYEADTLKLADNLVYIGFAFLTIGVSFGALWAKEAWGHYWTWDPKETWALLTWISYLSYIHFRWFQPEKHRLQAWILFLAFFILLMAWFGINYLPSAQSSVHVYSGNM